jgi:endonuclease YncB( thermonuclease family)
MKSAAVLALACVLGAAMLPATALAQDGEVISGRATAIDADIIGFESKKRVILYGVDAPERSQFCTMNDEKYSCYDSAIRMLEQIVSRGEVTCTFVGDPDPFNRSYGKCTVNGDDINAELIRTGNALAFLEQSEEYVPVEEEAKAAAVGVWQPGVEFELPWVWRKTRTPGGFR